MWSYISVCSIDRNTFWIMWFFGTRPGPRISVELWGNFCNDPRLGVLVLTNASRKSSTSSTSMPYLSIICSLKGVFKLMPMPWGSLPMKNFSTHHELRKLIISSDLAKEWKSLSNFLSSWFSFFIDIWYGASSSGICKTSSSLQGFQKIKYTYN